jgi:hypothetical protein
VLPGIVVRFYLLKIEVRFPAARGVPAHEVWKYLATDIRSRCPCGGIESGLRVARPW